MTTHTLITEENMENMVSWTKSPHSSFQGLLCRWGFFILDFVLFWDLFVLSYLKTTTFWYEFISILWLLLSTPVLSSSQPCELNFKLLLMSQLCPFHCFNWAPEIFQVKVNFQQHYHHHHHHHHYHHRRHLQSSIPNLFLKTNRKWQNCWQGERYLIEAADNNTLRQQYLKTTIFENNNTSKQQCLKITIHENNNHILEFNQFFAEIQFSISFFLSA